RLLLRTPSIGTPAVPAGSPSSEERAVRPSGPSTKALQWCRASNIALRRSSTTARASSSEPTRRSLVRKRERLISSSTSTPRPGAASMVRNPSDTQFATELRDVSGGLDVVLGNPNGALARLVDVDHERGAEHSLDLLAVELLGAVGPVVVEGLLVRVRQEGEPDVGLLLELRQPLDGVRGHAHDGVA